MTRGVGSHCEMRALHICIRRLGGWVVSLLRVKTDGSGTLAGPFISSGSLEGIMLLVTAASPTPLFSKKESETFQGQVFRPTPSRRGAERNRPNCRVGSLGTAAVNPSAPMETRHLRISCCLGPTTRCAQRNRLGCRTAASCMLVMVHVQRIYVPTEIY